ncbi:MAG TPA: pseudouridine synthase, partial [Syntrophomonas sp.]|nr:pseudouridine synthase [Syntrophomonas sp.]
IYPVGRLDLDTSGLLLLSNDGAFTNLMIHPRYKIVKRYEAWVKGQVQEQEMIPLRSGLQLEDGLTAPAEVRLLQQDEKNSLVEIAIHEGRKRQVKRMCIATGHPVLSLKRTGLAFLSLRDLKEGQYRHLSLQEIEALKQCAGNESNDHDG